MEHVPKKLVVVHVAVDRSEEDVASLPGCGDLLDVHEQVVHDLGGHDRPATQTPEQLSTADLAPSDRPGGHAPLGDDRSLPLDRLHGTEDPRNLVFRMDGPVLGDGCAGSVAERGPEGLGCPLAPTVHVFDHGHKRIVLPAMTVKPWP